MSNQSWAQAGKAALTVGISFVAGAITMATAISWNEMEKAKVTKELDLTLNSESSKQLMEATMLPTLLAAQQLGWTPEMFENNIKASFEVVGTIMTSLYQDAQAEGITFEEFKEKIRSEIEFLSISAQQSFEGDS